MSGSENPSSGEQFSLVSLEKSQQATSSYSNMSKRAKGESDSTLSINEDDPPPAAPAAKVATKPNTSKKTTALKKPPVRSEDAMDQSLDDILVKLDEFNRSLKILTSNASAAARNLALVMITPLLPVLNRLLKLINTPLQFINVLANKMSARKGGQAAPLNPSETAVEESTNQETSPPPSPAAKASNFSDMLELNIIFTDNMKKALYKKKPGLANARMGAMEEDLILSNALLAIGECAEFTTDLPNPASGLYAGQRIYDIMSNVTKDDVGIFLGFVKAYPGKYIGKEWKISETFATWLINNAPVAE